MCGTFNVKWFKRSVMNVVGGLEVKLVHVMIRIHGRYRARAAETLASFVPFARTRTRALPASTTRWLQRLRTLDRLGGCSRKVAQLGDRRDGTIQPGHCRTERMGSCSVDGSEPRQQRSHQTLHNATIDSRDTMFKWRFRAMMMKPTRPILKTMTGPGKRRII
jgi:hypothetical protein